MNIQGLNAAAIKYQVQSPARRDAAAGPATESKTVGAANENFEHNVNLSADFKTVTITQVSSVAAQHMGDPAAPITIELSAPLQAQITEVVAANGGPETPAAADAVAVILGQTVAADTPIGDQ